MNDLRLPDTAQLFETLCKCARVSSIITTDLSKLFHTTFQLCQEELRLSGAVVWLQSKEQDVLSPASSLLPEGSSTSAITSHDEILQLVVEEGSVILSNTEAEALIQLSDDDAIALAPIETEDTVLGLLGYIAPYDTLVPITPLLEANADILCAPIISSWLHREQHETDDIAETLSQFATSLRSKQSVEEIFAMLNTYAQQAFHNDWSGAYMWKYGEDEGGAFYPKHIVTRAGIQPLEEEPRLSIQEHPILELVISDPEINTLRNLCEQANILSIYHQRHNLRGIVLVPILHENDPKGLLTLGYYTPLIPLTSRQTSIAKGLAHMVGIALSKTAHQADGE